MKANIEEVKLLISSILTEWDTFSTHLQNMKEEEIEHNLFTQIDFLSQMDEAKAILSKQLFELEKYLQESNQNAPTKEEIPLLASLNKEAEEVLNHIKPKLKIAQDSYEEVSEEILRHSEDRIDELVNQILERRETKNSSLDIDLGLDEENELRELRDSLETYKEIRLENIEEEAGDPILDQLDSQIVACDNALLIDESSL